MFDFSETGDFDETGAKLIVPDDDLAKLMYYLKCVCYILEMDNDPDVKHFTDYTNFLEMSADDINKIVRLCNLASPDVLYNKFIFADDETSLGDFGNRLYERVSDFNSLNSENELNGQSFVRFMVFGPSWLNRNFVIPFRNIVNEIEKKLI